MVPVAAGTFQHHAILPISSQKMIAFSFNLQLLCGKTEVAHVPGVAS